MHVRLYNSLVTLLIIAIMGIGASTFLRIVELSVNTLEISPNMKFTVLSKLVYVKVKC